jgi:hypothetical protein
MLAGDCEPVYLRRAEFCLQQSYIYNFFCGYQRGLSMLHLTACAEKILATGFTGKLALCKYRPRLISVAGFSGFDWAANWAFIWKGLA